MTKKIRELQTLKSAKVLEANAAIAENDTEKAASLLDEADAITKQLDVLRRAEEANRAEQAPEVAEKAAAAAPEQVNGFSVLAKMLRKQPLSDTEKTALIAGDKATAGENLLIPEDVKLAINEVKKTYLSAKTLVNVETTDSLTGSVNYEAGSPAGLADFEDGNTTTGTIAEETGISFKKIPFKIAFKGKLIPVSRILQRDEKAGLMAYINRWFVRNAVISENASIFAKLKAGYASGTPKAVAGWAALKKSITVDLDPSCLIGGVIVTNQSGFACLDAEVDGEGRPILQPNPANPTEKLFQGLPVRVFPDAQLANIDSTHFPVIYGDLKAGCTFVEHEALTFDMSEHFLFNKNQNCLRVMEGYDVMSTDTSAYIYGKLSATPAST